MRFVISRAGKITIMPPLNDHPLVRRVGLGRVLSLAAAEVVIDEALARQLDELDEVDLLDAIAALEVESRR